VSFSLKNINFGDVFVEWMLVEEKETGC